MPFVPYVPDKEGIMGDMEKKLAELVAATGGRVIENRQDVTDRTTAEAVNWETPGSDPRWHRQAVPGRRGW